MIKSIWEQHVNQLLGKEHLLSSSVLSNSDLVVLGDKKENDEHLRLFQFYLIQLQCDFPK